MLSSCSREPEVLDVVRSGRWPLGCDPELRDHVSGCQRCADVLTIAASLQQSRTTAMQAASLAEPGILWWRAQLRRRAAAIEMMNRPIAGAQMLACSLAALAVAALLVTQGRHGLRWLAWIPAFWQSSDDLAAPFHLLLAQTTSWNLLLPALAALALLSGIATWLLIER